MREADVWKEIASILNVPEASTRTPQWFPTRLIAIQNIISRMDENETKLLDQQVQDIEEKGYPEEQKRAYVVSCFDLALQSMIKPIDLPKSIVHAVWTRRQRHIGWKWV